MRSEESLKREAISHVYLAKLTPEQRAKECSRIKRRLWLVSHNLAKPYSKRELNERYLLIRGMKDSGELRCGFDIIFNGEDYELVETFKPTRA